MGFYKVLGGSGGSGYISADVAPANIKMLWIDTSNGNTLKYHNGTHWVPIVVVWG